MDCSSKFPTWKRGGVYSYELGLALLMLWLAKATSEYDKIRLRYIFGFPLWDIVDIHPSSAVGVILATTITIVFGFSLRHYCPRCSIALRLFGLYTTSAIFGLFAYSFLISYPWSVGGGFSLFLSWRTFAVSCVLTRKSRRVFRACRT